MGTDRHTEFEGPCLCGKGIFQIDDCEVDHGWPTATPQWYEWRIDCRACAKKYQMEQRGKRFVLVEQSELKEIAEKKDQARRASVELMTLPEVVTTLETFAALLDGQSTMAAIHRLLTTDELEFSSVGTFRRGWSGSANWILKNVRPSNLLRIYQIVNSPRDGIQARLAELARLDSAASVSATPVGEPVHTVSI